jgi:hypothetical protein
MKRMHQLADEIRETFEDRGWKIEKATQLDRAFGKSRRSRSSLGRDLVLDAIDETVGRIGLACRSVGGGGCEVIDLADGVDRRFRVRKADVEPETGEYEIVCTSDSILVVTDTEPDSLIPTECWVLGYTADGEGMVIDIFAARVLGMTAEPVPRLKLGTVTLLGANGTLTPPSGRGFQPADEDDLGGGFGPDEEFGGNTGESDVS